MNTNQALQSYQKLPDVSAEQKASIELLKRVRKLRWIGMEDEARRLQAALRLVGTEIVFGFPLETD